MSKAVVAVACLFLCLSPSCGLRDDSADETACPGPMLVWVTEPSPEPVLSTTAERIDLAGGVLRSGTRLFSTRVVVNNLTNGQVRVGEVVTTEQTCQLAWSVSGVPLDPGDNAIVIGVDGPQDSASTSITVTRDRPLARRLAPSGRETRADGSAQPIVVR